MVRKKETTAQRLKELAKGSNPAPKATQQKNIPAPEINAVDITPPVGERGDFDKVSVTLPADQKAACDHALYLAKVNKIRGENFSVLVRRALDSYLPEYLADIEKGTL